MFLDLLRIQPSVELLETVHETNLVTGLDCQDVGRLEEGEIENWLTSEIWVVRVWDGLEEAAEVLGELLEEVADDDVEADCYGMEDGCFR